MNIVFHLQEQVLAQANFQALPDQEVIDSAKIFRTDKLTAYQQVNEEAGRLAVKNSGLLTKRENAPELISEGLKFTKIQVLRLSIALSGRKKRVLRTVDRVVRM